MRRAAALERAHAARREGRAVQRAQGAARARRCSRTCTDPQGRTGVGVEFDDAAWKTLFLFDPETGALLGTRSIGRKEVPGRNIDDWSLVIESGAGRDAAPPRPHSDKEVA